MIDFLKALKAVERSAKVRFVDDAKARKTTMLVGVHYGEEAVLNGLDDAHSKLKGSFSLGGRKFPIVAAGRERDLDKKHASYSVTTELLSEENKARFKGTVS